MIQTPTSDTATAEPRSTAITRPATVSVVTQVPNQ